MGGSGQGTLNLQMCMFATKREVPCLPERRAVWRLLCALPSASCGTTTPTRVGYAGEWSGTTAQDRPIVFTASPEDKVTSITVGHSAEGAVAFRNYPGCGTVTGVGWTAVTRS